MSPSDAHGFTPLHYAALEETESTIDWLIEYGADTNAVTHTLKLTRKLMFKYTRRSNTLTLFTSPGGNDCGTKPDISAQLIPHVVQYLAHDHAGHL